jgi:hypothetical protein
MRKTTLALAAAALAFGLPASAQKVTKLVQGSAFHGVHGIRFAPDGRSTPAASSARRCTR